MADSTGSTQSVKFAYNFSEVPPSDVLRECYRDLDRRGWDSAWFPEARDHDAVTLAALALA
ncbi:MAG: hypothetical protein HY329_23895, partial [Chloroflexi bacterium]|nr:hypothetical protein [Chloroflexota bacterium]